jgi:predicted nuclease of predicted toxin-antitoxin system
MRLLANENVPGEAVRALREDGHDVAWVRTDAPGCSDGDVLARARSESRVVITFDKDFGELAFRARLPTSAGVILARLRAASWSRAAPRSAPSPAILVAGRCRCTG